jgi:hypothetical protein
LWMWQWAFGFHKMQGIFCLAENRFYGVSEWVSE